MQIEWNGFLISDHASLLDVETVVQFLGRSYWANKRSRERIENSIANSLCFGVYEGAKQVGFARVVTDYATMYWLCDVFIDEDYRGKGIGKKLVESMIQSDDLKDLMGLLGTMDAHDLYRQYAFEDDRERMMRRKPDYMRAMNS